MKLPLGIALDRRFLVLVEGISDDCESWVLFTVSLREVLGH
jgi:hypothetical protein